MTVNSDHGPHYWLHETSGVLKPVVEAYLNNKTLSEQDIAILRQYLRQWIMWPGWDENPHASEGHRQWLAMQRRLIDCLTSRATIEVWLAGAVEMGMDPL